MAGPDRLRILVVEDEPLVALDLEDILTDLSHDVVGAASSVEQALDFVNNGNPLPDAAIVDANLGGQSARPVVETFRDHGIRVVVASGYGHAELARLGFDTPSINKPYSIRDVEAALLRIRAGKAPSATGAAD